MSSNKKIHAFNDDILADHDAVALAELLRTKQCSSRELVEAVQQRVEQVNPALNAIQTPMFDQALTRPHFCIHRFFSGVPIFLKDNIDIAGFATGQGSHALPEIKAKQDSPISQQILDQGFQLVGKTTLPEFGLNASTEYQDGTVTRNPWHLDYSCGASSGGSAALVAAGVIPMAHANDGGGSIRIPAAACGLIGLKPSRGRLLSTATANALPIKIISEGMLTRSVRDTAYFYAEMEKSYHSPALAKMGLIEGASSRRLRIGLIETPIHGHFDQETQRTVAETAELLTALGHQVDVYQPKIPNSFVNDFSYYWGSLAFALEKISKPLYGKSFQAENLESLTLGLSQLYQQHFYQTPLFLYRLKQYQKIYQRFFQHCDVLLSPVVAHTTPKLGYLSPQLDFETLFSRIQNYVTMTPIQNVAGAPAISLPMGITDLDQLPISVQFAANIGDEKTLIELAYEIEQARPWRRIQD